jgi:hypothetical protein
MVGARLSIQGAAFRRPRSPSHAAFLGSPATCQVVSRDPDPAGDSPDARSPWRAEGGVSGLMVSLKQRSTNIGRRAACVALTVRLGKRSSLGSALTSSPLHTNTAVWTAASTLLLFAWGRRDPG